MLTPTLSNLVIRDAWSLELVFDTSVLGERTRKPLMASYSLLMILLQLAQVERVYF